MVKSGSGRLAWAAFCFWLAWRDRPVTIFCYLTQICYTGWHGAATYPNLNSGIFSSPASKTINGRLNQPVCQNSLTFQLGSELDSQKRYSGGMGQISSGIHFSCVSVVFYSALD